MKLSDELHMSAGDHRLWVEVDEVGCPTGNACRIGWREYSRDLDRSVDNFKAHPRPLLMAIKNKMAAQFEYRGGLNDVPEEVFFQILHQQIWHRKSNMKILIESGGTLPLYVKKTHVDKLQAIKSSRGQDRLLEKWVPV